MRGEAMKYIEDEFRITPELMEAYEALSKVTVEKSVILTKSSQSEFPTFDEKQIKDVIFHNPATIVFWKDGTKTVVKCQKDKGDVYNPELGLAMCIIKKMCGNKGNYNNVFNKWLPKESSEDSIKQGKKDCSTCKYNVEFTPAHTCDICTSIDRKEYCMWEKK